MHHYLQELPAALATARLPSSVRERVHYLSSLMGPALRHYTSPGLQRRTTTTL